MPMPHPLQRVLVAEQIGDRKKALAHGDRGYRRRMSNIVDADASS